MTYEEYVSALQVLAVMQDTNGQALFNQILSQAISYAELRMYRDPDLDFLATRTTDISQKTQSGLRSVTIPSQFIVVEGVTLVTPANAMPTDDGAQRVPLLRTTRSWLDTIWPSESVTQTPASFETYWAMFSEEEATEGDDPTPGPSAFLIGPTPDDAYVVEVTGTYRPAPISETNPTTFISLYLPDLFVSASMVWIAGFQKSYGQQADDPKLAMSWEALYREQKQSAAVEEARKKAMSEGWSPYSPAPLAKMSRTSAPAAPIPPGR